MGIFNKRKHTGCEKKKSKQGQPELICEVEGNEKKTIRSNKPRDMALKLLSEGIDGFKGKVPEELEKYRNIITNPEKQKKFNRAQEDVRERELWDQLAAKESHQHEFVTEVKNEVTGPNTKETKTELGNPKLAKFSTKKKSKFFD